MPELNISNIKETTPEERRQILHILEINKEKSKELSNVIQNIIHSDIVNENEGITDGFFYQTYNKNLSHEMNTNDLPIQGYKFHISATDIVDYARLLSVVAPEFKRLGIMFKVVDENSFARQMQTEQAGKAITVYPSPYFDFNNFSNEVKSILSEQSIDVNGDEALFGRIYARYGRFEKGHYITTPDGQIIQDPKYDGRQSRPPFEYKKSPEEILTFYSKIANKFRQTEAIGNPDYKTYFQEQFTMTECDGKNHSYIAFNLNSKTKDFTKNLIKNSDLFPYHQSFVKNISGDFETVFIHKAEFAQFLECIKSYNIDFGDFIRPDWDIKNNTFILPTSMYETAQQNLSQYYNTSVFQYNGITYLSCDTCFTQEVLSECDKLGIKYAEYDNNYRKTQKELDKQYETKMSFIDKIRASFPQRPQPLIINYENVYEKQKQITVDGLSFFKSKLINGQFPSTQYESDLIARVETADKQQIDKIAYECAMVDYERKQRGLPPLTSQECDIIIPYAIYNGISFGAVGLEKSTNEIIALINDGLNPVTEPHVLPTPYEYASSRWEGIYNYNTTHNINFLSDTPVNDAHNIEYDGEER